MLLFYSTNSNYHSEFNHIKVNLKEALLNGQAPDRGLYMPESFPTISTEELYSYSQKTYPEIAYQILNRYTEGIIPKETLYSLCIDAYNFEIPLEKVRGTTSNYILRLDRGPTASFKDFAARMMARMMSLFICESNEEITILTATSGDTGAAVANAFHNVPGIKVIILFPLKEVSERQRKQMSTLSGNITTIAIKGKFDDCQALVKKAFADTQLKKHIKLSSANSINIGRLLPQSVYYFYAASRIIECKAPVVFSVPSGNFGDMMGGMIAMKMGLPIAQILAPVNGNDSFPNYLKCGEYQKIEPSRNCISNAMNVGHPSNLARLISLFGGQMNEKGEISHPADLTKLKEKVYSVSVSDDETQKTIISVWEKYQLLLEPHGAVGWNGYQRWLEIHPERKDIPAICLETAHPAKFPQHIRELLGIIPEAPLSLSSLDSLSEHYKTMDSDFDLFKQYLLDTVLK